MNPKKCEWRKNASQRRFTKVNKNKETRSDCLESKKCIFKTNRCKIKQNKFLLTISIIQSFLKPCVGIRYLDMQPQKS